MYKFRILKAVILQVFIAFASSAYAQSTDAKQIMANQDLPGAHSTVHKQKKTKQDLPGYMSAAIAKGYKASVLMWQINPETGNRMSAQFSGVVVSGDGVILSAAHVVMPGNTYKVMYANGKECIARGLGRITIPPDHMVPDAAMLKIVNKGNWPFAEMGWSSSLKEGQACISIAYPESLEQRRPNVRFGKITVLRNEYGFLQSTCIMEPGDSGGPLFDLLGRVVGIHSGIRIPEDINYEVPVDTYRKYWTALAQAQDYQSLPTDSSHLTTDSLKSFLLELPVFGNIRNDLAKAEHKLNANCLQISSEIAGRTQQISGSLISTKGLVKFTNNTVPSLKSLDFSSENIVVSKSSMIGDDPVSVNSRGRRIKLKVIARIAADDLILLLPAKKLGSGIVLPSANDSISINQLGKFLLSPRVDSTARIGVLSSLLIQLPNFSNYGYLGATTQLKDDKLILKSVLPNSAAELGGLKAGNIVLAVDGVKMQDELDFVIAIGKYHAGDTVLMSIFSADGDIVKKIVLQYPPQKPSSHPAELFYGGKSIRRDGFKNVFTQDAKILPQECGGPVFDLDNNFLGINIARFSRTTTVIMPLSQIMSCIKFLK